MWPPFCLTTSCKRNPCIHHNFSTQVFRKHAAQLHYVGPELRYIFWPPKEKSCDKCKGSFARGCEAKRWSHWTCSSLGTISQPMRINSVPDVKCFLIMKMCYVPNQWYDILCATLYNRICCTDYENMTTFKEPKLAPLYFAKKIKVKCCISKN